jgi:hypothetical protein
MFSLVFNTTFLRGGGGAVVGVRLEPEISCLFDK